MCRTCWEGHADADEVRWIADLAARDGTAAEVLGRIVDARAVDALLALARDERPRLRAAAIRSLGWSGDESCVPAIVPALRAPERALRKSARLALAELGGSAAVAALAATLDGDLVDVEQRETVDVLAWLGDRRVLTAARAIGESFIADLRMMDSFRQPMWAVVRLAGSAELDALRDEAVEAAVAAEYGADDDPSVAAGQARLRLSFIFNALSVLHPDAVDGWREALVARLGPAAEHLPWSYKPERMVRRPVVEPLVPRTVPRLAIVDLSEVPDPDAPDFGTPPAKFGGQPDWIAGPQWPVGPSGTPLIFYGQLPLPEHPGRMAYIFYGQEGDNENWEPLHPGNAVVVQPGGPCHLPTVALEEGPRLFREHAEPGRFSQPRTRRPYERFAVLRAGADPAQWTYARQPLTDARVVQTQPPPEGSWADTNKIGGVPNWLQDEQTELGDGWRYAFQFSAGWAAEELGDGAECYAFIRDEDLRGAILWQCH